jgi:DNA gyrase/topoisomerase IV subunit A
MLPLLINNAQEMRKMELQRMNRIEQLERIKLIENLNLSEEQSIRFFSRRNDHKKEIESIEKKVDELLSELNKILNSGEIKEAQLKKINEEILTNREKIATKRKQFIQSLTDILTTEQISKLLLFEIRFRDEIKNLIMKRRNHPR